MSVLFFFSIICLYSRKNNSQCPMYRCPIQKNLVEAELLTIAERKWLDDYHKVWEKVSPLLKNVSDDRVWGYELIHYLCFIYTYIHTQEIYPQGPHPLYNE